MGNFVQWEKPLSGTSWTETRVEKSTTLSTGPFSEIATVAIATSFYFDFNGLSTDYYRIRFYDATHTVFSGYSSVSQGTSQSNVFSNTVDSITIMGLLGATAPNSSGDYVLYGMSINQNVVEAIVRQVYNYTLDLAGSRFTDPNFTTKVNGFIIDYASLRILGALAGISIPTHFNYTLAGLNIQKPVVSQIRQAMDAYLYSCKRWQKMLLSRFSVGRQTDLELILIDEKFPPGSGIVQVTFDAQSV